MLRPSQQHPVRGGIRTVCDFRYERKLSISLRLNMGENTCCRLCRSFHKISAVQKPSQPPTKECKSGVTSRPSLEIAVDERNTCVAKKKMLKLRRDAFFFSRDVTPNLFVSITNFQRGADVVRDGLGSYSPRTVITRVNWKIENEQF
ncbi:hypothetical protein RRG08_026839 [Elysia crispata]|uniref:Uncharacterized protein n=1 Tax=Elysia crispata TaxID=231223 RepID=A0AAE0Y5D5_9GAST|nr:hypothetical protein RRG08_026839 [Elysia crispata]